MNKQTWLSRLPGDWRGAIEGIYERGEIAPLFSFLRTETREKNKVIVPLPEVLWNPFKYCAYKDVKVVVVGESAYERVDDAGAAYADGMFLSCHKDTGELNCWYQQLETQRYSGLKLDIGKDTRLTYLGGEGLLMLSMSPTTEKDVVGAHKEQWKKFMENLFKDVLASHKNNILYLLIGEDAHKLAKHILPFDTEILQVESIREAARQMRPWNSENFFSKADEWCLKHYGQELMWQLPF